MNEPRPLDPLALANLYAQLTMLQRAGIAPLEALPKIQTPALQPRVKATLQWLRRGLGLAEAGRRGGLFLGFDAALLAATEMRGEYAFAELAARYEARVRRRRLVIGRLWLPVAVLALGLLVRPLPALVGGSLSLGGYLVASVGTLALLLGGGYLLGRLPDLLERSGLARYWDAMRLALPWIGPLVRRQAVLEFARSLGLLLAAGVPILEALPKAVATVESMSIRRRLGDVEASLRDGATFAEAVAGVPELDRRLRAFVASGDLAGSVDRMLLHFVELEEGELTADEDSLASWVPRLFYLVIALWIASALLSAGPPGSITAIQAMDEGR